MEVLAVEDERMHPAWGRATPGMRGCVSQARRLLGSNNRRLPLPL